MLDQVSKAVLAAPGVDHAVAISGISALDNSASLQNAGAVYVVLKDWSQRGAGTGADLRSLYFTLQAALDKLEDANCLVLIPPPIQGIGNASGFTMQIELRDGNTDYEKLERLTRAIVADGGAQSALQRLNTPFRSATPQLEVSVDRVKAETLNVAVGDIFNVLGAYVGSGFVNQFNKFGQTYQVYVQADSKYRLRPEDIEKLYVRSQNGNMVPLGTLLRVREMVGPALISLYNLYPTATIVGGPGQGFSTGEAIGVMEEIADQTLPPGTGYEWTAMSYQEKQVGSQIVYVFGFALLLVYLCLAGRATKAGSRH